MTLTVAGLDYRYAHRPVLRGIDLAVAPGEVVSLVGPNGAGKSTLLKCINRILKPGSGRIDLEGRPVAGYGRRDLARAIAYVPQQAGAALSLPVIEMVALGRAPHRAYGSGRRDREIVLGVLERLGLETLAMRRFGELSGGERQRVLLARALAQGGRLMLLDEPTSALDLRHQLETMTIVRAVAKELGIGALIAIHDLGLAGRFSDRLVMLSAGRVHAEGPWTEVLTSAHLEAAYGVSAVIGSDGGLPYIIPTHRP